MRAEYDFSGAVRGATARRYAAGTNVVLLDADVALHFRDGESVNRALRALVEIAASAGARRTAASRTKSAKKSSRAPAKRSATRASRPV
jgi:hypothetical protein